MTRRVLILSYHYPPSRSVACIRLRGLTRFLPQHGWEPVVVAAPFPGVCPEPTRVVRAHDPGKAGTLLKRRLGLDPNQSFQQQLGVPEAARERRRRPIVRRAFGVAKGLLIYPDDCWPWAKQAEAEAGRLLRSERFDALVTSSYPHSAHVVGRRLQREHGVPWVADLRDLWSQNHLYPYGPLRWLVDRRLERRTLRSADAVVTVSRPWAERLGRLLGRRVETVRNGFDPDERWASEPTPDLTLTYAGTLYEGRIDPTPLFGAVRDLIDRGALAPQKVRIRFFGDRERWLDEDIARFGLGELAEQRGWVARDQALAALRASQVLLYFAVRGWPSSRGLHLAKIYEYLAMSRPVLAVGRPGPHVARDLLGETRAGVYATSRDEVRAHLARMAHEFGSTGQVAYHGRDDAIRAHAHPEMARRFAAVLDGAARGRALDGTGAPVST